MLRAINGSKISEKVSVKSMLDKFGLLSVNQLDQLAAQIKLKEVWKSLNSENYPIVLEPYNTVLVDNVHCLRPKQNRVFNYNCRLQKSKMSFNVDAARVWNAAPPSIKQSSTIYEAKRAITAFVSSLPI